MKTEEKIMCLVAPANPNLDKLTMMWLLVRFGPGTSLELHPNFTVGEFTSGKIKKGKTADGLEECGFLFLDCGGGRFDGHGRSKMDRCSGSQLIADELSLQQDPRVKYLVKTVNRQDLKGRRCWDEIASVVVNGYRMGRTAEEVREWVFKAFDAIVAYNERILADGLNVKTSGKAHHSLQIPHVAKTFLVEEEGKQWTEWGNQVTADSKAQQAEGRKIAEKYIKKSHINHSKLGMIKIATCRSEGNPTVLGNIHYLGADVAMSRFTPKGSQNTTYCISVSKEALGRGVNLYRVIAKLRIAEAKKLGISLERESLACLGTHPSVDAWHIQEGVGGARIYNRTEQHQTITATLLDYREMLNCVTLGLKG